MKNFKSYSLNQYLDELAKKSPVPGGGSAAALAAALGAALISMAVNYSLGRGAAKIIEEKLEDIKNKNEKICKRLLMLVDLDARAYLKVVKTRKSSERVKAAALKKAQAVPWEVTQLCYEVITLTPFLVRYGNRNLISDIEVAVELLFAAYNSAMINVKINQ